jgi:hypothetical protein
VNHFGAGDDVRASHGVHLDSYYITWLEKRSPGLNPIASAREFSHTLPHHVSDRLRLELARDDAGWVLNRDDPATKGPRNAQLGAQRL